jgi:hypothetical protein
MVAARGAFRSSQAVFPSDADRHIVPEPRHLAVHFDVASMLLNFPPEEGQRTNGSDELGLTPESQAVRAPVTKCKIKEITAASHMKNCEAANPRYQQNHETVSSRCSSDLPSGFQPTQMNW